MGETLVTIRPATLDDSTAIWQWRNDPTTRAASITTDVVPWEDHVRWFAEMLPNPHRHLLVAEQGHTSVGVVRFDLKDPAGIWNVSINLAPSVRGNGLSLPVLQEAQSWLFSHTKVSSITATVRQGNATSQRLFEKAGYTLQSTHDGFLTLVSSSP